MIKKCKCAHKAQDQFHGPGNRVHIVKVNGDKVCTVCENLSK